MQPIDFVVPRTARYYALGEAGPDTRQVWFCLGAHGQPVAGLAQHLAPLVEGGRLLILPEGLSRHSLPPPAQATLGGDVSALAPQTDASWFAPDSLLPDLADLTNYLDLLAADVLARCPSPTPFTVLGYGEGAAAACRWLAGGRQPYSRLVLYNAVFPAEMDRRAAFVGLPERPVFVFQTQTAAVNPRQASSELLQDLADVGLPAELHLVGADTPVLMALQPLLLDSPAT